MPTPNITIAEDEDDDDGGTVAPRSRPAPLIMMPKLSIHISDDSDDDDSDDDSSDVEDMMTAEEEAAARRYLSGSGGPQQDTRRMSSLDVYLAQPQQGAESMIINRRLSLRGEQEAIDKMNEFDDEGDKEKARVENVQKEREAVKREREAKAEIKRAGSAQSPSPSPRRTAFHKKGFGGLSREKRKKLKEIIMRKAREELNAERLKEMHAKETHLKSVIPPYEIDNLDEKQLQKLIQDWHKEATEKEIQRIELAERVRKQDEEIRELTSKLIDIKGKYPLPILRKVPRKVSMLARLERLRALNAIHIIKPKEILKSCPKSGESGSANPNLVNGLEEDRESKK